MNNFPIISNAQDYGNAIALYANETGKSFAGALAREAPDFRTELFNQFRRIHPPAGSIFNSAKGRGYRVARTRSTALVPTAAGLSSAPSTAPKKFWAARKATCSGKGWAGALRPVRFGARGSHRVLLGGRTGFRFSKSALRGHQLSPEQLAASLGEWMKYGAGEVSVLKGMNIRRLNLRALATYLELTYRERGARGGTMAVQWLFKTWKKVSGRAQLVQRSATGIPIGTIDFEFDAAGDLQTVVFNGYVPGTAAQAAKHGLVEKAFAMRVPALLRAIQLSHQKAASRLNGYGHQN